MAALLFTPPPTKPSVNENTLSVQGVSSPWEMRLPNNIQELYVNVHNGFHTVIEKAKLSLQNGQRQQRKD